MENLTKEEEIFMAKISIVFQIEGEEEAIKLLKEREKEEEPK